MPWKNGKWEKPDPAIIIFAVIFIGVLLYVIYRQHFGELTEEDEKDTENDLPGVDVRKKSTWKWKQETDGKMFRVTRELNPEYFEWRVQGQPGPRPKQYVMVPTEEM